MLFQTWYFCFVFLPVTLIGFFWLARDFSPRAALGWLVTASIVFYAWWNPLYVAIIMLSVVGNWALGWRIHWFRQRHSHYRSRFFLIAGLVMNLAILCYYKYADFTLTNLNWLFGWHLPLLHVVLPLAISFHTFQQIAYLVDAYHGKEVEPDLLRYVLFVTFFPQLIAGPIVHHHQVIPQFRAPETYRFRMEPFALGLTIFAIGLFKKVVLADSLEPYIQPAFSGANRGEILTFFEAWGAALGFTLQLYFDFSGYSDMAIGLGRMFGIVLPLNFNSPYKAVNIIDFWRRWHITLSSFLRDYLYIPLGGNRCSRLRQNFNLLLTMLLGGLWHGAAWTFVLWGGWHGLLLLINHRWRTFRQKVLGQDLDVSHGATRALSRLVTFIAVVFSWVVFKADSLNASLAIWKGMLGQNGLVWNHFDIVRQITPARKFLRTLGIDFSNVPYFSGFEEFITILLLLIIVFAWPNTQEVVAYFNAPPAEKTPRRFWRPTLVHGLLTGIALFAFVLYSLKTTPAAFVYFRF
jgi:D-alanyl-lipoteichoic acid acyltransferase DltB (MBOAT superfamily)